MARVRRPLEISGVLNGRAMGMAMAARRATSARSSDRNLSSDTGRNSCDGADCLNADDDFVSDQTAPNYPRRRNIFDRISMHETCNWAEAGASAFNNL